ncbi:MAG: monovalent cation/H+ antiporter complex subunit F [Trueperella sp.]|nr:monovalent cation/H+ antiporter complex subunit F [Trueperella sp.]
MMLIIFRICGILLFISAFLVILRILKGPSSLDRMVGVDFMTSILVGAFSLLAAITRRADLVPVLVVLSVVGFVGSTAMARFITPLDRESRRKISPASAEEPPVPEAARAAAHSPIDDAGGKNR